MASVSKQIRKSSKLRKRLLASVLTLSLAAPIMGPQVSFADDQGYTGEEGEATPYTGRGAITTYKVKKAEGQPEIEVATQDRILEIDGKYFRDANGNKSLDVYEDWRKPTSERVADLISKMDLSQKAGMMYINTHTPEADPADGVFVNDANAKIVKVDKLRHVIYRLSQNLGDIANYNNQMQQLAEGLELGIPVVITSNPRNSQSTDYTNITNVADQHTFWPGTLGLAAARDAKAVGEFADIARQEWRAAGIRKVYGYMADVATDPLWARIEETFGEDPKVVGDMNYELVKGFQTAKLGADSVAITVKHFPGGGARDDGQDPHFANGSFNIYPTAGSMEKYHLPPFERAIEAGVASVMPYYAFPSNDSAPQGLPPYSGTEQFEEVGMTLNEGILAFLRAPKAEGGLDFKGYVNSDSAAVSGSAWGYLVDKDGNKIPDVKKVAKALNAGTNIISGGATPQLVIEAVNSGLVDVSKVNESITYTLSEMMTLGLFEDPYVNPTEAIALANDDEHRAKAYAAHQKSVVLMRNDEVSAGQKLLPLTAEKLKNVKLYVEGFIGVAPGRNNPNPQKTINEESAKQTAAFNADIKKTLKENFPNITLVDNVSEATHAYLYVKPTQSNWDNDPRLDVDHTTGILELNRIIAIQKAVPTITAVNFTNQWLINELEPNTDALIATFGTQQEAVFDVITGKFNPVGKLPFAIPASKDVVNREVGDVPSFAPEEIADFEYVNAKGDAYAYGFGLSYTANPTPVPTPDPTPVPTPDPTPVPTPVPTVNNVQATPISQVDKSKEGHKLPNTATNAANLGLIGATIAALGGVALWFQRRRRGSEVK
ncbi:glycoside hydrolase family 3 N-terminal domain-containing protein [Bacillus sp. OK048]|uniref:glycoside hydrolase family 3 N-terminal domain-containing protein n=1 Tax=Bacillus sp. OK048 TaxID=1882761 RepID=UPI00088035B5|nr:glycoside hydrolase family 3 N-terminal domain-containing protein [Bacillus sp. OK048]SDM24680.1 beta-glucosidase [Bacillus sp. OK048]